MNQILKLQTSPFHDGSKFQRSWNTHMCQVICNPGMNFMKVHAFLLKGWCSSLNTLVSNRKSSSPSSSARESVTSTCYPRFKNMKWFWQDQHDSRAGNYKTSFIIPWWQASLFILWQASLFEKPWLHLKWLHLCLILIPLLISPKTLTI